MYKVFTYKVIEVVTFQTKFEVKFTDQYKNKCSMFSKDCNFLTIIEHYDELIEVESVKASYQNQNGIVKLDLTDMVNHSSYGYDEAYNDYVYRDPEYLAAHDINFFGALTGKVMDKNNGYVINQVFVTYKMKKTGDKNYGVSKTITFNYNASNNTFKAISER